MRWAHDALICYLWAEMNRVGIAAEFYSDGANRLVISNKAQWDRKVEFDTSYFTKSTRAIHIACCTSAHLRLDK